MSDRAYLKHVFIDQKATGSTHPYESPWMMHWKHSSFNPTSQVHESHSNERKEVQNAKQGQQAIQILKSKKARILGSDVDLSDISESRNAWRHGHGKLEVASSTAHPTEEVSIETMRMSLTNDRPKMNSENVKSSDAKTVQCDSLSGKSFHKLPGSSVNQDNLTTPFPYLRNTASERKQFLNSNFSQTNENLLSQKEDVPISNSHLSRSQIDGKSGYAAQHVSIGGPHVPKKVVSLPFHEFGLMSEGDHSQAGVSQSQHHQIELAENVAQSQNYEIEVCRSIGKNRLPVSIPFRGSSSSSVQYGTIPGGSNVGSCTCEKEKRQQFISGPAFKDVDCGNCDSGRHSSILASDKKLNSKLNHRRDGGVGQNAKALERHNDAFKGNPLFPVHVKEQSGKINNFPVTQLLPGHSSVPRVAALENLKCGMPTCSFNDEETWCICTTMDSVEGMTGGPSKCSKTTHHLTITRKGGVDLSRGDQMTKDSAVSAEFGGNTFHNLFSVLPFFGFYHEGGRRFQSPGNMIDRVDKKDEHAKRTGSLHVENESSAETDPPSVDVHQSRSILSGEASAPFHKDFMMRKNAGNSQAALASSSKEIKLKTAKTELPDMNEEPPASLAVDSPVDDREPSTSKTESLGMEHFLSHVEQPETSNSSPQQESPMDFGPEASSRWVKRLRLNALDSLGTNSSILGDASSSRKVNELFTRIMSNSKSSSEPLLGKYLGKGAQQDKTEMLLRNRDTPSLDSVKDHQDLSLSNSWIRRWCRNRDVAPQAKAAVSVVCEPQKKQYPSIAAMALMGKAVSNFRPCEFRKRGSLVVWNTKG